MKYKRKDEWGYELTTYVYMFKPYQSLIKRKVQHTRNKKNLMYMLDRSPYLSDKYKDRVHFDVEVLQGQHKHLVLQVENSLDILLNVPNIDNDDNFD